MNKLRGKLMSVFEEDLKRHRNWAWMLRRALTYQNNGIMKHIWARISLNQEIDHNKIFLSKRMFLLNS